MNVNKSVGPDGIHPRFLKELSGQLCIPLAILFNLSLHTGLLPSDWTEGKISAIFKKGSRRQAGNYRPVSLTCIICKCMEHCIRDHIDTHMRMNNLYSTQQYGFIKGRSTVLQLLTVMDTWTKTLDSYESIDIVYLDFLKAFDTVPHRRLIGKLKSLGITGSTLNWVEAFLSNRRQRVTINGTDSEWANVTSGIPQGSVLGPILFVLYINDLPSCIHSNVFMFADDTKVFKVIKDDNDVQILQADLENLATWSSKWLLRFHPDKCKIMHVGTRAEHDHVYTLNVDNTVHELRYTDEEKDIGVIVDSKLEFDKHIYQQINKASSIMAVIRRSFITLNVTNFTPLYKALVRSHLEYASCVWSPYKQKYKQAIEKVQRRATKQLPGMNDRSYQQRLEILKLPTLVYRRIRGDMIETYKLVHNKYDVDVSSLVKMHANYVPREGTRGHGLKLYQQRSRLNLRKENFPMRITNIWNELPENVVMSPSVNTFKNRLDKHWSTEHFLYDYRAAIPGNNRAEDRAREFNDDLTTEAPRLQSGTS